jgi:hypothetical protein
MSTKDDGAEARKEWREAGACTNCDTPVTLVHNSDHPTCRMDRRRYVDARFPDRGWCLFRCKACHAVIDKNWAASEAPNVVVTGARAEVFEANPCRRASG